MKKRKTIMKSIATVFYGSLILFGLYVSADSSPLYKNISGESDNDVTKDKWIPHPTDSRRRRLQLSSTDDCLLVKKVVDYEDDNLDKDVWSCEFSYAYAKEYFNGQLFLDIEMMGTKADGTNKVMGSQKAKDAVDELKPVSGESILKTPYAFVEESLDSGVMVLYIPEIGQMKVQQINENNSRHYKQRRMNRQRELRSLANSRAKELSVLVVRVVDNNGSSGSSEAQLKDDIFDDPFSLKTGYAQCSKNELIMKPATGNIFKIRNGIITINLGISASAGSYALERDSFAVAQAELGNLSSQWDLVMFCQPPSGSWLAYAYVNSWVSYYNGRWCNSFSAQMHEVGHNLGLGHSNEPFESYGDMSCLMGYSYDADDGPKMCFNAAKNYQLGWYDRQKAAINPLLNQNTALDFVLNGVELFEPNGDNGSTQCGTKNAAFSDYRGSIASTISGRTCQRWDNQSPHSHTRTLQNYPNSGLEENYCRNPDGYGSQAWCYTTDPDQRWEYCEVPDCDTISETNDKKLITLRIIEYGDSGSRDYYVGFNDAFGVNSGTLEGRNQVLIFRKDAGGPNGYGESYRIGALNVGNSITIPNFRGVQNVDVTIKFNSLTNGGRDANIEIVTSGDDPTTPPTLPPTQRPTQPPTRDVSNDCDGIGRFQFELTMDDYASETAWKLIDNDTNSIIEDVPTSSNNLNGETYLYPRDDLNVQLDATDDFYCLQKGKCYTMIVTDSYGDGMTYGNGGFYTGYLDLETKFDGDGSFTTESRYVFCVGISETELPAPLPTPPPTSLPTPPPTPLPTLGPTPQPINDVGDDCNGMGRFKFELTMDDYASETAWKLIDNATNIIIEDIPRSDSNRNGEEYLYPRDDLNVQLDATDEYYCLPREKCYTMIVTDSYGDGMGYGEGGYYAGYLDDETVFLGYGRFTFESRHDFCVGILETEPPSSIQNPTFDPTISAPTFFPTSSESYPTFFPTLFPTEISPNTKPIESPAASPTDSPTTVSPTVSPTEAPTELPTESPTESPTELPTESPTESPTELPTDSPTASPTKSPSQNPSSNPTISPTKGLSCEDLQASGIVQNNPVQQCVWISLVEGNGDDCPKLCKVCADDSTHAVSDPACEDDEGYKYNGKKKKYCTKLSTFSEKKRKRLCKKEDTITKQKVKDSCRKTCGCS